MEIGYYKTQRHTKTFDDIGFTVTTEVVSSLITFSYKNSYIHNTLDSCCNDDET